tara:strand:- start:877 stop:1632 length:756 start_codon:yes stop_codon:yes gene_type:complete
MGINLDKMREKLAAVQNRGDSSKSAFWRPEDGDQTIRIVPTADGDPFKEVYFHYNVAKGGIVCPKRNYGEECPICDFASNLWREGTNNNDESSKKMAKSLFARQRFFSPVLVRGEENEGPRWWGYGKMAYETLLSLVLNPDYGDITDTEEGTDIVLSYGKPPGASFPQTKLQPRRRTSNMMEDAETNAQVLDSIQNLEELFERKTTAEVQTLLDEFMSQDVDAESASSETVMYNKSNANSVDQAFNELMNA